MAAETNELANQSSPIAQQRGQESGPNPDQETPKPAPLFLILDTTTHALKIGTCGHCVVQEPGRPSRAWNPNGDSELDFNRDRLLTRLAALGVKVEIIQEYVCP